MSAVLARRYAEARPLLDSWERLDSAVTEPMSLRVASYLGEGDTLGARRTLAEAQRRFSRVGFTEVVMGWASAGWLLDDVQRRLLLNAPPEAFGAFATSRAITLMQLHDDMGDSTAGLRWADSALAATRRDEKAFGSAHPGMPAARALVLTRLGRYEEARTTVADALRLSEADRIGFIDPVIRLMAAEVLMRTGRHDEAVDRLEEVLRVQYMVSPAWLRVDPTWRPLRGNPRFDGIVAAVK
jgi:tetratricopeptide (TPR) repeat protein